MKKGFGWFLVVLGVLNVFRFFAMLSIGAEEGTVGIFIFAIIFLVIGIKMISSSKTKSKVSVSNNAVIDSEEEKPIGDQGGVESRNAVNVEERSYERKDQAITHHGQPKDIIEPKEAKSVNTSSVNIEQLSSIMVFSKRMEDEFINSISEVIMEVKDMDTLTSSMVILKDIATTSKYLKEADFSEFSKETGITREELNAIIDRTAKRVHDLVFVTE